MTDDARLTAVEEKLTHLEHDVAQLDGVVRETADQLAALAREMKRLRTAVEGLTEKVASNQPAPDPADEKPPHW